MSAWPSISLTAFGLTPRLSSSVAAVWRKSWKRTSGSLARAREGLKERLTRLSGIMMPPSVFGNTRSSEVSHLAPKASRSSCWRMR